VQTGMPTFRRPSRSRSPNFRTVRRQIAPPTVKPVATHNPLADPEPLIRRVYAYVAYRIGDGADAEDVTSEVFERALRYRATYDPKLGSAIAWLTGIARRCIADSSRLSAQLRCEPEEWTVTHSVEADAIDRIDLSAAVRRLDQRSQDLLALRYGADLSTREIGRILDLRPNAVEVALHRARTRVRQELEHQNAEPRAAVSHTASA
jgi:RNA polymerase sigma-70 factor (ECF subfamily)